MYRAKLLDRRPMPLTAGDIPMASDVFLHNLERSTQEALRWALEQSLRADRGHVGYSPGFVEAPSRSNSS